MTQAVSQRAPIIREQTVDCSVCLSAHPPSLLLSSSLRPAAAATQTGPGHN